MSRRCPTHQSTGAAQEAAQPGDFKRWASDVRLSDGVVAFERSGDLTGAS